MSKTAAAPGRLQHLGASVSMTVVALAAAAVCHVAHVRMDAVQMPQSATLKTTMPSPEALRMMAMGYQNVVADYYWLKAINHFGDKRMTKVNYPNLEGYLRRIVALDPKFGSAYIFAGTAMTLKGMDEQFAMTILAQGEEERPDLWRIPFLAGFNAYYVLGDYGRAAQSLGRAASRPDAPAYVGQLAARLAAEAGEPNIGLALVDSMLATVHDPVLVADYTERRRLLILEIQLRALNEASANYQKDFGHAPATLQELRKVGVDTLPTEPLGGRYEIDAHTGVVTTTNEARRLRLRADAKGLAHGTH